MLSPLLLLGLVLSVMGGYVPPGPRFRCPKEAIYIYPCTCLRGSDRGLYVRCENTNLASLSLAFVNLGNEGMPIEELVLHRCNIGESRFDCSRCERREKRLGRRKWKKRFREETSARKLTK